MDIDWKFPLRGGGEKSGFNMAEMAHFEKNDPYTSLSREVIQNSLDAGPVNPNKPVEVVFEVGQQSAKAFPEYKKFINILQRCKNTAGNNDTVKEWYDNALKLFEGPHIDFLKVSDSNTTGLRPGDDWENLVKNTGKSNKQSETAGGSWGFGKFAPFASSQLRTVFISSLDKEDNYLFQGKTTLQTHKDIDKDEDTQRSGYYGFTDDELSPVNEKKMIHPFFLREEIGASVYVAGFDQKENWYELIALSVLQNFFPALYEVKLTVSIRPKDKDHEAIILKKIGLDAQIAKFTNCPSYKQQMYLKEFYEAFKAIKTNENSEKTITSTTSDFESMGEVKVSTYQRKDIIRKEIAFRNNGMIIEVNNHRGANCISFLEIIGEDLNVFLRKIENPTHDAWEAQRYKKDPDWAETILRNLKRLLRESRDSLANRDPDSEIDFSGMEKYLPDDPSLINNKDDDQIKEDINKPKDIELKIIKRRKAAEVKPSKVFTGDDEGGGSFGENEGTKQPGKKKGNMDNEGPGGGDDGDNERLNYAKYNLQKIRVLGQSKGSYELILLSEKEKSVYLELAIRSEDRAYDLEIESVSDAGHKVEINEKTNYIGPIDLRANIEKKINVHIKEKEQFVLGVKAYEFK